MMRVLILLLALVATPFVAGVSQDQSGSDNNGVRGRGHDAEHCAMRVAKHPGKEINKCPVEPAPVPIPAGGVIDGTVYNDIVGRPGLSNWVVELSGDVTATTRTDASGHYVFVGLPPGTYTVCETVQSGWRQTFPPMGASCLTGVGYSFTLPEGTSAGFNNFGNVTP